MISNETATALRESTIRFHKADQELRAGESSDRVGDVVLATEYVQARREHPRNLERAEREEQILDEGQ